MGVPEYKINSSIRGILAQRLLRKVCPHCSVQRPVSIDDSQSIGIKPNTNIRYATVLSAEEKEKRKRENTLCLSCNGAGYNGRIGTYEFLPISREIQVALKDKKTDNEIENIAVDNGMLTLLTYGRELVKNGLTTVNEVLRICKN